MKKTVFIQPQMQRFAVIIFVLTALACLNAQNETFPQPQGAVNDFAKVISNDYEHKIEDVCIDVWNKTKVAIVVATFSSIGDQDYRDAANRLYEQWGIGGKEENKGILLFNVVDQRKIWIETGYGVEGFLNDARVGDVYREIMRPWLAQDNYNNAFWDGVCAFAGLIAQEYNVEINESLPTEQFLAPRKRTGESIVPILFLVLFLILVSKGRGGRGGRRRSALPWIILGGLMNSGGNHHGGFGGGFSGGGGFGGFGGGMSGGGGAGGGY